MITINISLVDGRVRVGVNRWPATGRYPVPLTSFELLDCAGESELALVARCARAVELQCEALRLDAAPELPF